MILIAIWDKTDDIMTRKVTRKKDLKTLKHRSRKPDKLIVDDVEVKGWGIHKLRQAVAYDGLVISTKGAPIYDGRRQSSVRSSI